MSESGLFKFSLKRKKRNILISLIIILIVACIFVFFLFHEREKKYSFDEIEKDWFTRFNFTYPNSDEYEINSLDVYCIEDDNLPQVVNYYVHAKFKAYNNFPEFDMVGWDEIDEVSYGRNGHIEVSYCLSWDNINGFESINEDFNKAIKEGYHKSYTQEEIEKLIEENPFVIEE